MGLAGVQQAIRPAWLVTEQEQTLRIAVQPADGIHAGRKPKLCQGAVVWQLLGELGENVEGLVEGDQQGVRTNDGFQWKSNEADPCRSAS